MTPEEVINSLVRDLVKLAVKTNAVLTIAQIPATHAKEAAEVLEACKVIYEEFVSTDNKQGTNAREEK